MVRHLAIAWSTWKLASKRFGPMGGFAAAALVVIGLVMIQRLIESSVR